MSALARPITFLGRSGTLLAKKLKVLGIETCEDLIFYFPRRFDDFSHVISIVDVRSGMTVTIRGRIDMIANRRSRRSRMMLTEALVSDETGSVKAVWFNQPFLTKNLHIGDRVSFSGKTDDQYYDLQFVNPAYEKIGTEATIHTGRLTPVYSLPSLITQKQIRTLIRTALDEYRDGMIEWLPSHLLEAEQFPEIKKALEDIHFPLSPEAFSGALMRFKFEELFLLQLANARVRESLGAYDAHPILFDKKSTQQFLAALPFVFTADQKAAGWEIVQDMNKPHPMNRLLQGDVGAGKTVVAALAMLNVVRAGYQFALMAPTEVLATQHYNTLRAIFDTCGVSTTLLTSSTPSQEKRDMIVAMRDGSVDGVIGTHALIQEKISFQHLALAVVDEQHRFGVKQRLSLRGKNSDGAMPHLLSMTATPIPRSLALTIYGDLDISTIRTMPKGRKKIITKIVPQSYREWTYDFIRTQVAKGRQAYILCPMINESDTLSVRSVSEEYRKLSAGPLKNERVAMLHGKIKTSEKDRIMQAFRNGEVDILVTTSVIEVGIDVPNATIMCIEGAERFGLAQLHQLRGRVGRSHHQSYCFLAPSDQDKEEIERLKVVVASNDGFVLAEKDLELRREGDMLGSRQSGQPSLKVASLLDSDLIKKARAYAEQYVRHLDKYPALKSRVTNLPDAVYLE